MLVSSSPGSPAPPVLSGMDYSGVGVALCNPSPEKSSAAWQHLRQGKLMKVISTLALLVITNTHIIVIYIPLDSKLLT